MTSPLFSLTMLAVLLAAARLHGTPPISTAGKKVIYYGWNTRDTAYVAEHWAEMEQTPFDGIGISIALDRARPTVGDGSTANLLGWQIFGAKEFSRAAFNDAVADLQKPRWTRFTENFLPLAIATRDQNDGLSWFEERRWATIEMNWRVLLEIAREGRCRGLLLDPEHYDYECELFSYRDHRAKVADRSFEDYVAAARRRGRQLGTAVREVFPHITIGLLYGYTLPARELPPGGILAEARYALLPAFLDGLLESSAPDAKFVDLWEFGHLSRSRAEFFDGREAIKTGALAMTANPSLYKAALSPGMSVRIDSSRPATRLNTRFLKHSSFAPFGFEAALRGALDATDRYVWIYSEAGPQFFPPAKLPQEYVQAIHAARGPASAAPKATSSLLLSFAFACAFAFCVWLPVKHARRRTHGRGGGAMRVLFVTGIFPPDRGGPASYVPKMAAALTRRGHHVEVICLSGGSAYDDAAHPFRVHRIRRSLFWPIRVAFTALTIWHAARRHDLVYVNGLGAESALASALARRPTIHKIVGDYAWERAVGRGWFGGTIEEYQSSPKTAALRFLDFVRATPLKLARGIIVPSRYLKRLVTGWSIPVEKIRIIPNAIRTEVNHKAAAMLPPWEGKTLITVCRLVPWKGVDALIRLLPSVAETRLLVAGDGHLRSELESLARISGVADRVLFLGDVPHASIPGYLSHADAFVLNSTYEGLPHVVLEAIAAGIPVIATDAGGTAEVVEHNVSGLLIPVRDDAALTAAVEQLWRDPALGRRFAAEAARRARMHFDFDAMVAATEETLRSVYVSHATAHPLAAEGAS